jgi:hypothetical protein
MGLSLVRLCSLGSCRGVADYPHRVAPHWPNLKDATLQPRGAPLHPANVPSTSGRQSSVLAVVLGVALAASWPGRPRGMPEHG